MRFLVSDMYFPRKLRARGCPALPEDVPCWDSFGWEGISEIERSHKPRREEKGAQPNGGHQDSLATIFGSIGLQSSSAPGRYRHGIGLGWAK